MAAQNEIKFYSTKTQYGFMSNFYRSSIIIDEFTWPTTEHYFQAMKFSDLEHQKKIREASTAGEAAKLGRRRHSSFKKNWDEERDEVMMEALMAKFTQHQDLKKALLATGDANLIEDSPTDYYWGIGADGSGKNMLGIQLMEVRRILREMVEPKPNSNAPDTVS